MQGFAPKRRAADRPEWQRVTAKRFTLHRLEMDAFTGFVSLLAIDAVHSPLELLIADRLLRIADAGFVWLQYFPEDQKHTLTVMWDEWGELVQLGLPDNSPQGIRLW